LQLRVYSNRLLAAIAPLCFVDPFDLTTIIYANIQNLLHNFAAPCPHISHTKFHQNQDLTCQRRNNGSLYLSLTPKFKT